MVCFNITVTIQTRKIICAVISAKHIEFNQGDWWLVNSSQKNMLMNNSKKTSDSVVDYTNHQSSSSILNQQDVFISVSNA